jgi:nitrogen regulatory protein P-II 2
MSRELSTVTCLTIVAEAILEQRLVNDMQASGARGWTVTPARGKGPRDRRISEIDGGNIRVEVLASPDVIDRIWQYLEDDYFPNYAITAWSQKVQVARASRYADDADKH